jgi:hypothetical protein
VEIAMSDRRIRIDKTTRADVWYGDHIGEVFTIEREESNRHPGQGIEDDVYWVRTGGPFNTLNWVFQKDATILDQPPKTRRLLDIPASEWDGPRRAAARATNPMAWRLDSIDTLIEEEEASIKGSRAVIDSLRVERASLTNDDEKACNLFAAMASYTENEKVAKAMTLDQLAEHLFGMDGNGLDEAVVSEVLARAGYVYRDDEIGT